MLQVCEKKEQSLEENRRTKKGKITGMEKITK
jgi:hypothetical protein